MKVLKLFLLLSAIICGTVLSHGQTSPPAAAAPAKVTGRVVDEKDQPLAGIVVMVKDNIRTATSTNSRGEFTLNAGPNDIVALSAIGLRPIEITASRIGTAPIVMSEAQYDIEEVVTVGYGEQKRGHLAGAVSTIKTEDLTMTPLASTTNALAGKLPGLIAKQEGGLPGFDESELNIRGFGSPLVIVDGIESGFNEISAGEIESVTVLKDASAAVYGSRAGNGVIIVTTKRGRVERTTINYDGSFTMQMIGAMARTVNAGQYAELQNEYQVRNGVSEDLITFRPEEIDKYYSGGDPDYPNTNWYDYLLRKIAPQTSHSISMQGGNNSVKFYAMGGYTRQESIVKEGGPTYDRYNVRMNADATITRGLTMSGDLAVIQSDTRLSARVGNRTGATTDAQVWEDLRTTKPIYATELPDPTKVAWGGRETLGGGNVSLNRHLAGEDRRERIDVTIRGMLNYNVPSVKGLKLSLSVAEKFYYSKRKSFPYFPATYTYSYASDTYIQRTSPSQSPMTQSASDSRQLTGNLSAEYAKVFNKKHNFSAKAIYEVIDNKTTSFSGSRTDFILQDIDYLFAGGNAYQTATSSATFGTRMSFVGRANYVYNSRYILELTGRYDGTDNYPKGARWGFFPSASLAWRISEEPFIKNNNRAASILSNVKLRASVSQTGNDVIRTPSGAIISYPALGGYNLSSSIFYVFRDEAVAAVVPASYDENPYLSWETMRTYNVGLDYALFKNAFYGELDAFYRTRHDIPATRRDLSSTSGGRNKYENINQMSTRGFEFSLGYRKRIRNLTLNVSGNVSWSRSKWDYYNEPEYTNPDDIRTLKKTGRWTDTEYGYRSLGIFTSQEQINALNFKYVEAGNGTLGPGDIIYLDYNGDGILTARDYVAISKGRLPHWMFGFDIKMQYKNLSLHGLLQGALGFTTSVTLNPGNSNVPIEAVYNLRWTEWTNNPNSLLPRYMGSGYNNWTSDFYQKKGDYLRLKNLRISYKLPQQWFNNKIGSMSVSLSGSNLFTISELLKYNIDPEAPSASSTAYYPQMRTISLGLRLTL